MKKVNLLNLLFICFFLSSWGAFAQRYQEQITFTSAGDIELSLGRYRIGGVIRFECNIGGPWAEDGGIYHIAANWGGVPKVVLRSESSITHRLKFYGYVDPTSNTYAYLFAKWDNQSPGESSNNTLKFSIYSEADFDVNNSGSFSSSTLLDDVLISQLTDGSVGIGCITSGFKLSVDGKIAAEEIKVQTVPASDYVFEPDYDLRSLEEVDNFIQQNKHLPDIPSAEEFKENGVGLGEMDDMLLRKVEELTLYVIEQDKKLQDQNRRLEKKETEIEELKEMVRELIDAK